jgi:UDP-N-acetyl-D-mannosaminuronic acid dehydrogenase
LTILDLSEPTRSADAQTADLTVVGGAGHVGIPLVLSFAAKGFKVNVNDLNVDGLDCLRSGRLPFIEHGAEEMLADALRHGRLVFTSKPSEISKSGPVIITIGTPIDEFLNPERHVVKQCIGALIPFLRRGQLLVLRSTLYPGTTDWISADLERMNLGLKVAFCPERIVQGYGVDELATMPQIVSGTTPEATEEAAALFRTVAPEIVMLDPIEAEFAKLFNNAYRYIEFATTNQFYLVAKSAGLDYQRILRAMKYKYPRAKNIPTPGYAAGPCLMKDTMQLAAFARNEFTLGNAAMLVNEGLPLHVVADLRRRYDLGKMTVGLLGMAFKPEVDDIRASLSYKFKKILSIYANEVLTTDPFVTLDPDLLPFDEVIERSELLILCTPHNSYKKADLKGKPVVDVWGVLENANLII